MTSRNRYSGASAGPISGPAFLDQYATHIDVFYRSITLPLTGAAGVNAVTATLDPALTSAGLIDGMRVGISWPAANTGAMTLSLNGGAALPVRDANGAALPGGSVSAGLRSTLEYLGGAWRVQSPLIGAGVVNTASYFWQFTSSGTWTKPSGLDEDRMVTVEAWGGGGGGATGNPGGGGGGGGYVRRLLRLADLPASVAVAIGAGGAVGAAGGNTTFGSLLTAYGGAAASGSIGGGGGGTWGRGSGSTGGRFGGGAGGTSGDATGSDAGTEWGGGGGGFGGWLGAFLAVGDGGFALFGGGGGGAAGGTAIAGSSWFGGGGGAGGAAGSARGGGGGGNAAGCRGEVRVWL